MAEGFVKGDFVSGAAAFNFSGEDFADFGRDVGVVDKAGGFGVEEFGSGGEYRGSAVGDVAGADHEVVVDLGGEGITGADDIDVSSLLDPCTFEDRFCGR